MPRVCLIFPSAESHKHWMTERTFKRAGLRLEDYPAFYVDDEKVLQAMSNGEFDRAILFGEESLNYVLGHHDILRWMNRWNQKELRGSAPWCVPCLEPMRLLARRYEEEETGGRKKRGMRHPPRWTGVVVNVIKHAILGEYEPYRGPKEYLCDPRPKEFERWADEFFADDINQYLSWDIETPYKIGEDDEDDMDEERRRIEKTILRISFAYKPYHAVSVPWLPEYLPTIKRLLGYTGYHVGWNAVAFDIPIVEANGVDVKGTMLDGMDAWHLLQSDLDKGLEVVTGMCTQLQPWKHLSDVDPALYNAIDADAALQNFLWIAPRLLAQGLLSRFIHEMYILQCLNMAGQRGNKVDEKFRLELKTELEAELLTLLRDAQSLVKDKFLRRKYYARVPKNADPSDWATVMLDKTVSACSGCGKIKVSVKHKCLFDPEGWKKETIVQSVPHYYHVAPMRDAHTLDDVLKVLQTSGFNPCSADQMKKYMKAHRHPVGINHKTKEESADVKHIQKLVKKYGKAHPIYAQTLKIRLLQKALSTYVNGLEPDDTGRIHTTYVNSPSTWRLGSRNINVQNLGKRNNNPYAKKARRIIIPSSPEHVLVQADSTAIEAVFVGKFAGNDDYIREAKLGVHAGLCCKWLGIEPTKENRAKVKAENGALYDQFKTVVHGTNFGMGPYMMHMNDPEKFPSLKEAEQLQDFLFEQMKGLREWHHQLRVTTKKNGYLDNPWGLRHYFYDVFTYAHDDDGNLILDADGLPKVKLGKDGKRVIAFKPQSSAGMFMRDNIALIAGTEACQWMPAVMSIHDGYCLDVPYQHVDTAVQILGDILTRPIPEMDGLRVGCAIEKSALNFLDMEHVKTIEV